MRYRDAGVDIAAGDDLVRRLKVMLPHIGDFSGAYPFPLGEYEEPILVSSTDGVGTKLLLAIQAKRYDTVGIDLVAMSVNDLITCGARPLFFLDYFATGMLEFERDEAVVRGIIRGCEEGGCILLGGETAEMPGMYRDGDFDLAGFAVGVVERSRMVKGENITPGDVAIGIPSNGIHSNGYSLVRKLLSDRQVQLDSKTPWSDESFIDALLRPTRIYARLVLNLVKEIRIDGIGHITGGGLPGNAGRMLPAGCDLVIDPRTWQIPPVFRWIEEVGPVPRDEMWQTFNMGVGLVIYTKKREAKRAVSLLNQAGESAFVMGEVTEGEGGKVRISE